MSRPGRFTMGERYPSIHCVGDWVVAPRSDKDKKFLPVPGIKPRSSSP